MATIFFSYSHADEDLRNKLETHLAMLKHQGFIETWNDRRILAGSHIDDEIDAAMERADVILLLISADFLSSQYCYGIEVKKAMARHAAGEARVIPVILRHCDWHDAPFGKLLATPRDGKPIRAWQDLDEAFLDVVKAIKAALKHAQGGRPPVTPPQASSQRAAAAAPAPALGPRSSNLRLRQIFTEVDRDRFLEEGFDFMAKFFEGSLAELKARHPVIDVSFRRIDANCFTAAIYRDGKSVARCTLRLGGFSGRGITYKYGDNPGENSFNEQLTVEADDQSLYWKPMGMTMRNKGDHFTNTGAAEYYWALFIEPLQQ